MITYVLATLFTASALLCQISFSQTTGDTTKREPADTTGYLIPSTELADLNMIQAPPSFVVSEAFNGYISYENSTAIIMTLINNTNYLLVADGMDESFYAANGLNFISETKFTSDYGVKGVMFKLWFKLKGDEYIRYMVYAGDLQETLWLNITYPKMLEELIEMEILKSIQSINLNP